VDVLGKISLREEQPSRLHAPKPGDCRKVRQLLASIARRPERSRTSHAAHLEPTSSRDAPLVAAPRAVESPSRAPRVTNQS
jgi:hypothetical protein